MIGTKSSGSSSDQKSEPKSEQVQQEQVQQTHKGQGKEIQRRSREGCPSFAGKGDAIGGAGAEWHSWKRSPQPGCFVAVIA